MVRGGASPPTPMAGYASDNVIAAFTAQYFYQAANHSKLSHMHTTCRGGFRFWCVGGGEPPTPMAGYASDNVIAAFTAQYFYQAANHYKLSHMHTTCRGGFRFWCVGGASPPTPMAGYASDNVIAAFTAQYFYQAANHYKLSHMHTTCRGGFRFWCVGGASPPTPMAGYASDNVIA